MPHRGREKKTDDRETARLRETVERLRRLIEEAPASVFVHDLDGRILDVNRRACERTGYLREELLAMRVFDIEASCDPDVLRSHWIDLPSRGPQDMEGRHRRKDGTTYPVEVHLVSFVDQDRNEVVAFARDVSTQKEAELALRKSEHRYRAIVEQQGELVCRLLPDGTPTFVNEAYCRYFGITREQIYRNGIFPLIYEEDIESARAFLAKLIEGKCDGTIEHRSVLPDGRIRWIQWVDQAILDEAGQVVEIQGVGRDITELKTVEEALRASETRFRRVFDASPVGMAIVRCEDQRFLQVNPRLCNILGYCETELQQRTVFDITHPDERQAEASLIDAVLAGQMEIASQEKRLLRADGQIRWVRVTGVILPCQEGEQSLALGVTEDITERLASEEALRQNQQLNAVLLNAMPCVAMLVRPVDRAIIASNQTAARYGAAVGEKCYEKWIGLSRPCPWCRLPEALDSGQEQHREIDRQGVVWEAHWVPISEDLCLHYAFDITERRKGEERLQQMQHQLAHTARLSTMGELVAGIAHEVNQPLYSIINYAKACKNLLAQGSPMLETVEEWIEEINAAANRAGDIIRRLRDFTRRANSPRCRVRIDEVVRESVAMVSFELRARHVEISLDAPPSPVVLIDRIQIQQVLVNLLRNAAEAMDGARADRKCVTIRIVSNDQAVEVSVDDRGPGLPVDTADMIFEPFFTTKPNGLGIGLAISKSIIEAHNGRIGAAANPQGGARLTFTLPRVDDEVVG